MMKERPRAVLTTPSRFQALADMEPQLRKLLERSTPVAPGSGRRSVQLGRMVLDFIVDGREVRFWLTEKYVTHFAGVLDPLEPSKYCDGRVRISTWIRGEWEAQLGSKVETFDPLTSGVLPRKLKSQIRAGLKCWPVLAIESEQAFRTIVACLDEPFDSMLLEVLARNESSDAQLDTLMRCIPHPNFAVAVTLVLALNLARPCHVQRAWEISSELAEDWDLDRFALARKMAGSKAILNCVWDYMTWPSLSDDDAALARDLFFESFFGIVDPDGTRAGQIIDRLALALRKRGIA